MAEKRGGNYKPQTCVELITHQERNVKEIKSIHRKKRETSVKVGCWNVRTIGNPTKLNSSLLNVITTMKEHKVCAMVLAEVRWFGCGVLDIEGATVACSGSTDNNPINQRGTAVILLGNLRTAWKENKKFTSINERLMKTGKIWLNIISVYAPTDVTDPSISEEFYHQLSHTLKGVNNKDLLLMLGDFNARIGPAVKPTRLRGIHNLDTHNKNGERLLDFCTSHGLVITNTLFPHKKIHQWSWRHPNQNEGGHVLDYILVNQKFRAFILDTRAHRNSLHIPDHHPVISKIRIDININTKLKKVSQYNPHDIKTTSLSPETIKKLNKYLYPKNKNGTVEEIWENFKSSQRNTTEQFFPKIKKLFEKKWVTNSLLHLWPTFFQIVFCFLGRTALWLFLKNFWNS